MNNILDFKNRNEFRKWLKENSLKEKECFLINLKRGKPKDDSFYYLDAVEEALCFGWIDSIQKRIDGVIYQRFSPRNKKSPWSELNKERVRRLIKLGLMEEEGRKVLPSLSLRSYKPDIDVINTLKENRVFSIFKSFPSLYQRVRIYNVSFFKKIDKEKYQSSLKNLIEQTKKKKMFGEWNDYGRLLDY